MATVLLFGRLAEQAGWRSKQIALPANVRNVAALRAQLQGDLADIGAATTRAAVNRLLATDNDPISDEDEIAFMPPMSGG